MPGIKVTWITHAEVGIPGPVCDLCNALLPNTGEKDIALLEFMAVAKVRGERIVFTPPWTACKACQDLMGLKQGDTEAGIEEVRQVHRRTLEGQVDRYFGGDQRIKDEMETKVYAAHREGA